MTNADMTTKGLGLRLVLGLWLRLGLWLALGLGLRYAKVEVLHKQTNMKHVQLMVLILVSDYMIYSLSNRFLTSLLLLLLFSCIKNGNIKC